jgi:hypothetical protein
MLISDAPATLFYIDGRAVHVTSRTDTAAFVVPASQPEGTPRIVALRDLRTAP